MKTKKTQHTPTPWKLEDKMGGQSTKLEAPSKHQAFIDPMTGREGVNHTPHLIARISTFGDEGKANAAFIVRAVNCHEELLITLKEVQEMFCVGDCGSEHSSLCKIAKKAIAKAEGK